MSARLKNVEMTHEEFAGWLGRRIQSFATERGMSINAVSRASGVSQSHLSLIVNGKRTPTADVLLAIARALGVTTADLMSEVVPPSLNPKPAMNRHAHATWIASLRAA